MKLGLVQQANSSDRAANIEKLKQNIRACALQGAELVVLQELHNGLYFCQTENTEVFDQAEPIPGPSTEGFGALAKELGIVLVLSLFEKRAPGLYHNTAVVIEKDGTIAGKYRKMHIPDDPAYYEKFYFIPGDLGFEPINWEFVLMVSIRLSSSSKDSSLPSKETATEASEKNSFDSLNLPATSSSSCPKSKSLSRYRVSPFRKLLTITAFFISAPVPIVFGNYRKNINLRY